ncbi:MAG TPA: SDR family NAD(P)-dependent oxidoreductase [Bordetella sp.]|nr:SDR family NAD(P)-dependent oxidoreductase [Bordetella sp.]
MILRLCGVTRRTDCEAAVAQVVARYRGIDTLVNNAGVTQKRGTMEIDDADYEKVQDTNLRGVLHISPHPPAGEKKTGLPCTVHVRAHGHRAPAGP